MMDEILTHAELAAKLDLTEDDLRQLVREGYLTSHVLANRVYYLKDEIIEEIRKLGGDGTPQPTDETTPIDWPARSGYVYIARSGPYHKIGKAIDVQKRLHALSAAMAKPLELVHAIFAAEPLKLEAKLHERFAAKKVNRELFDLTAKDVVWLRQLTTNGVPREERPRFDLSRHRQ